jgi:hypothetical protein
MEDEASAAGVRLKEVAMRLMAGYQNNGFRYSQHKDSA